MTADLKIRQSGELVPTEDIPVSMEIIKFNDAACCYRHQLAVTQNIDRIGATFQTMCTF